MPTLTLDETHITYRDRGAGPVVLAIPGGPLRGADYLEEFGHLPDAGFRLITLELPGTDPTPVPDNPAGLSAPAISGLVKRLHDHLGLDGATLLSHSAGAGVSYVFAQRYPQIVSRMVLVTPSNRCLGLQDSDEEWAAQKAKRSHEPWFPDAAAALEQMETTGPTPELTNRITPMLYARWDERARDHNRVGQDNRPDRSYYWQSMPDKAALAAAMGKVTAPVRLLAGDLDMAPGPELAAAMCALFPNARAMQLPGCAHYPWVDNPTVFRQALLTALTD